MRLDLADEIGLRAVEADDDDVADDEAEEINREALEQDAPQV